MSITASDIAKLRNSVGAGMMDCKVALEEANGDMDKAAEILRKKGIVKAAKRADKIAAEGTTIVKVADNTAVIAEINCETDFVTGSDDFKKLVDDIADSLLVQKPADLDSALVGGINEKISTVVAKIGEKISLRRFVVVEKSDSEAFGDYLHMGGKISVLTVLTGTTDSALAREVGMHAAAAFPKYLNRAEVPTEILDKEKEIASVQLKAQNKPANIIENILKGKVEKYYTEVCLVDQPYIKDEEKSVAKFLESKGTGIAVKQYVRYELGEGIEKKEKNFADEVNEQLK
ncbi:MAG: translation elongation factor Ts [Candidatus Magasanikbacteria bacterium]